MNIYFCGYMGVGKSSVARDLAMKLQRPFTDLDAYIEYKAQKSIHTIFKEEGEEAFRELEYHTLQDLMKQQDRIIALGGGSVNHHKLNQRLRKNGLLIYLEASPEFLYERLLTEKNSRPLISQFKDEELLAFIKKHLGERENDYLSAQLRINVEGKTSEEIISYVSDYLEMI